MFRKVFTAAFILFIFLTGCSGKKTDNNAVKSEPAEILPRLKRLAVVGMANEKAGLYEYTFRDKKISPFWLNPDEGVVELSYSKDMKTAFILTAKDYGRSGTFPYIDDAKIYMLSGDSNKVSFIESVGNGIQVFMLWNTDNTFKIILNSFDQTIPNYVNQHTQIFNTFGKILFDEVKTYDITKNGYPKPADVRNNFKSPDGVYSLAISAPADSSIYLLSRSSKKKILLVKTGKKLNQAEWSPDGKFLIFSLINILPENKTQYEKLPDTPSLFVYSIKEKKILTSFSGSGFNDFYVVNNFLIYDNYFEANSSIKIINYKTLKSYDRIVIKGGCGLRNIPQIPDYGAQ